LRTVEDVRGSGIPYDNLAVKVLHPVDTIADHLLDVYIGDRLVSARDAAESGIYPKTDPVKLRAYEYRVSKVGDVFRSEGGCEHRTERTRGRGHLKHPLAYSSRLWKTSGSKATI
jgi:hypothetical protein